jgi:hypothetical protein
MLGHVENRQRKRQVHFLVPKPQGFLRERQLYCAGRHARERLRCQQGRLIHEHGLLSGYGCPIPTWNAALASCANQSIHGGDKQDHEQDRKDLICEFHLLLNQC